MGAKTSPNMEKARQLVTIDGMTQAEASRLSGISKSAISQSEWYREHVKKVKACVLAVIEQDVRYSRLPEACRTFGVPIVSVMRHLNFFR